MYVNAPQSATVNRSTPKQKQKHRGVGKIKPKTPLEVPKKDSQNKFHELEKGYRVETGDASSPGQRAARRRCRPRTRLRVRRRQPEDRLDEWGLHDLAGALGVPLLSGRIVTLADVILALSASVIAVFGATNVGVPFSV